MDIISGIGAVLAACLCAWSASTLVLGRVTSMQQRAKYLGAGTSSSVLGYLLASGVRPFHPLARLLCKIPYGNRLFIHAVELCEEAGHTAHRVAVCSSVLAGAALIGLICGLGMRSLIGGLLSAVCAVAVCAVWIEHQTEQRESRQRELLPQILTSMESCLLSGLSLPQTLEHIARTYPGGSGRPFVRASHVLQTGGSTADALACLKAANQHELTFVSVALGIQHESGGSLMPLIGTAKRVVRDELELSQSLRVQTAQARLSARVVTVIPFVLIAVFSLISPGFLQPFFSSPMGFVLMGCAIVMQVAGVLCTQRCLQVV